MIVSKIVKIINCVSEKHDDSLSKDCATCKFIGVCDDIRSSIDVVRDCYNDDGTSKE